MGWVWKGREERKSKGARREGKGNHCQTGESMRKTNKNWKFCYLYRQDAMSDPSKLSVVIKGIFKSFKFS